MTVYEKIDLLIECLGEETIINAAYEYFDSFIECLGEETIIINSIFQYFSTDQINNFCDNIANDYDLDFESYQE